MKWWTLTWYYVGRKICYINLRALTRFTYNQRRRYDQKCIQLIQKKTEYLFDLIEWWKLVNIE